MIAIKVDEPWIDALYTQIGLEDGDSIDAMVRDPSASRPKPDKILKFTCCHI